MTGPIAPGAGFDIWEDGDDVAASGSYVYAPDSDVAGDGGFGDADDDAYGR